MGEQGTRPAQSNEKQLSLNRTNRIVGDRARHETSYMMLAMPDCSLTKPSSAGRYRKTKLSEARFSGHEKPSFYTAEFVTALLPATD